MGWGEGWEDERWKRDGEGGRFELTTFRFPFEPLPASNQLLLQLNPSRDSSSFTVMHLPDE